MQAINDNIISQTRGLYINPEDGTNMPIPEAMNRGLILVEYTNSSVEKEAIQRGIITTTTTMETVSYSVKSVIDPITGLKISVGEAIDRGIIDQRTGRYINPKTGKSIPITEAIDQGFLNVVVMEKKPTHTLEHDYVVNTVFDPRAHRMISLEEAIRRGLIDPDKACYVDPKTGHEIPLAEAVKMGMVRARIADPEKDDRNPNLVRCKILKMGQAEELKVEKPKDANHMIFSKIKDKLNMDKTGIREQTSGKELTISEAFELGVLHMHPVHIQNANGDKYSLHEAAALGIIDPLTAKEILKAIEPNALDKLIEAKVIDAETGQFIDPKTGKKMTIAEAIQKGLLDPDKIFYCEIPTKSILSLTSAIENGKFNPETGKIIDPKTGQEMSLADAIKKGLLDPSVNADKIGEQISALKFLKDHMDPSMKGIKNPLTGEDVSIEDAILMGILDLTHAEYINIANQQSMSIPEAIEAGLIDPKTAKAIYNAMSKATLGESLAQSNIDPNSGKFIHPETKRRMTIKEAIDNGHLDPNAIFVVDPSSGRVTSLAALIEEGRFNPITGKFKDPLTGLEVSIANAIKKGIIGAHINPDEHIEEKCSVKDLLDVSKANPNTTLFVTPDGQQMSLKEALANGFLTPDSIIKVDPKTGNVTIGDGSADMLKALIDTKKNLDWIAGVETSVAQQGKPNEHLQQLNDQLAAHKVNRNGNIFNPIIILL